MYKRQLDLRQISVHDLLSHAQDTKGNPNTELVNGNEDIKYSRRGYDEKTGIAIYQSDYPEGTSRALKAEQVIKLVQNVWSRQPLSLTIPDGSGGERIITAQFNPTLEERSDLSKIAYGNRHGSGREKRITMNLSQDFYAIAAESHYVSSKDAESKPNNPAHDGVKQYHYFSAELLYAEYGIEEIEADDLIPVTMSIDVKETDDGDFFYSFHAEESVKKESAQQTLHAAVVKDYLDDTFNKTCLLYTSVGKSASHQKGYGGEYFEFVKALSCIEELAENAVPIEVHKDKKEGTRKANPDLKNIYVFVAAFEAGKGYIPVQMEVKEFIDRSQSLYLNLSLIHI